MTMSDRIAVMNRGHYEQLGDPEVLYERPRTPFVAGFLGVSNLLSAKPNGASDGYAGYKLADGTSVRIPRDLAEDMPGDVSIGVRPEKIRLSESDADVPGAVNRLNTLVPASVVRFLTQEGLPAQESVVPEVGRVLKAAWEGTAGEATRAGESVGARGI